MRRITFEVPDTLFTEAKMISCRHDKAMGQIMREALKAYCRRLEGRDESSNARPDADER